MIVSKHLPVAMISYSRSFTLEIACALIGGLEYAVKSSKSDLSTRRDWAQHVREVSCKGRVSRKFV